MKDKKYAVKHVNFISPSDNYPNGALHIQATDNNGNLVNRFLPFKKVTEFQLLKLRTNVIREKSKKAFAIYRNGENLLCTAIPNNLSITKTTKTQHLCNECERCSAAPDKDGGCRKVRDHFFHIPPIGELPYDFEKVLQDSSRIEKYPFITDGIEIFNGKCDTFHVGECKNFQYFEPRKKYSFTDHVRMHSKLESLVESLTQHEHEVNTGCIKHKMVKIS